MKELLEDLTAQLGIDHDQAQAGAAILFKAAKEKLGRAEFQKLLGAVPGIADLVKLAPAGEGGGLIGELAAALGGNAAMLAGVVAGFSNLGLSVATARKFVPVVLEHLRKHVGADVVTKIETALRS